MGEEGEAQHLVMVAAALRQQLQEARAQASWGVDVQEGCRLSGSHVQVSTAFCIAWASTARVRRRAGAAARTFPCRLARPGSCDSSRTALHAHPWHQGLAT